MDLNQPLQPSSPPVVSEAYPSPSENNLIGQKVSFLYSNKDNYVDLPGGGGNSVDHTFPRGDFEVVVVEIVPADTSESLYSAVYLYVPDGLKPDGATTNYIKLAELPTNTYNAEDEFFYEDEDVTVMALTDTWPGHDDRPFIVIMLKDRVIVADYSVFPLGIMGALLGESDPDDCNNQNTPCGVVYDLVELKVVNTGDSVEVVLRFDTKGGTYTSIIPVDPLITKVGEPDVQGN